MSHYVLDENNNKIDAYSAQEVLSVLEQAIADGSLANVVAGQAIVDKLKCCVGGATHRVAFVTQAKYNELKEDGMLLGDCLYFITDDNTAENIEAGYADVTAYINGVRNGSTSVPKAAYANNADNANNAENAKNADILGGTIIPVLADKVEITETGLYAVRISVYWNSQPYYKFYTDYIWISSLGGSSYLETYGALRHSDGTPALIYNHETHNLRINNTTGFGGISASIEKLKKIY